MSNNQQMNAPDFLLLVRSVQTGDCYKALPETLSQDDLRMVLRNGGLIERRTSSEAFRALKGAGERRAIIERGPIVARYLDADIPDWVRTAEGVCYGFKYACGRIIRPQILQENQFIVEPGLVFERM